MMENKDTSIRLIIGALIIVILTIITVRKPDDMVAPPINPICKEDSLRNIINQLESQIRIDEDGWDKKEERYSSIIFEYEYGLNRIKETHPDAYKEFHRIISYKERYSREDERDNNKRLKMYNEYVR